MLIEHTSKPSVFRSVKWEYNNRTFHGFYSHYCMEMDTVNYHKFSLYSDPEPRLSTSLGLCHCTHTTWPFHRPHHTRCDRPVCRWTRNSDLSAWTDRRCPPKLQKKTTTKPRRNAHEKLKKLPSAIEKRTRLLSVLKLSTFSFSGCQANARTLPCISAVNHWISIFCGAIVNVSTMPMRLLLPPMAILHRT